MPVTWSYSSISLFKQCPKKYYHLKVARDYEDKGSNATMYGQLIHKTLEDYMQDGVDIPPEHEYLRKYAEPLAAIPGTKHCEVKLGVSKTDTGYSSCEFFDKSAYYRGIADLVIIDGNKAWSIDYKTGKSSRYADMSQLNLVASAVFLRYPEVDTINSALMFVVADDILKKKHYREHTASYLDAFAPYVERLEAAINNNVWNANPSGLCGWCPVTDCMHWKAPRRK